MFRRAVGERTDDVLSVLDEAAEWLDARGAVQWPLHFEAAWVAEAISRGETCLVEVGDEAVGTVTLEWSDLWADVPGPAGYVHRMAVRWRAAGPGEVILGWAAETAERQRVAVLRLDCVTSNRRLRSYYETRNFVHRGDVPAGGASGQRRDDGPVIWVSRYELPLAGS